MPSGNEVTVTVSGGSTTTVTVPSSTGTTPTITNGGTANVTITSVGDRGPKGDTGPATTITIGTVTGGTTASATLTGTAPNQTLNLVLPKGDKGDTGNTGSTGSTGATGATGATGPAGPANSLSIGTVTTGAAGSSASATITGTAPTQTLSLTIPRGDVGATGATGPLGPPNSLTIGTVSTVAAGGSASATITGTAPNQTLNLTIPRGDKGTDGADVEFQATATHIQWRYAGGSTWTNLVPLSSITGPANTLSIGTTTTGAAGSAVSATITGTAPSQTLSLTIPRGNAGVDGREVQLQKTSTHVQWRYATDTSWTNLVALADITGPQGAQGPATITVGTTTTLAGGSSATVTNSGTTTDLVLDFGVPRGTFGDAQTLSTVTGSYTLAASDAGKLVLVNSSSSANVTVPANASVSIPVGTHIDLARIGNGTVTVQGDTGVTVNATPGLKLRARYSTSTLIKVDTNTWLLVGDIAS